MERATLVRAALLALFSYVFLANHWIGDDAHITFRAVWNLVHGYGFTFNPDERVQAFTDPLWALLIAPFHLLTGEFYFTVTLLSWLCCVAAGAIVLRRAPSLMNGVLITVWILSSKALVDYTSSGLEYPLSYLLIALFYVPYCTPRSYAITVLKPAWSPSSRDLRYYVLLASLAFVTRVDMALLFAVPVAELLVQRFLTWRWKIVRPVLLGGAPALAWLLFATFYYGFPLPNTYYAKVANGIPTWLQHQQGWAYLLNSVSHDPITLGTVAFATIVALRVSGPTRRAALSALLYVAYTVSVGGDFMSGRFFAMPFLVAAIAVVPLIGDVLAPWFGAALVLYNVLVPIAPIKTTAAYDSAWPWRTQNGIKDERGITHQQSNLLTFAPFRTLPDTPFAREGISFGARSEHALVYCCIGMYGLNAGPDKHVVDDNALSDPLLARLPVSPRVYFDFWASHYFRDLPDGYVASNERNENVLTDPLLHEYYDRLRNVTRGPLWSRSRWADIWRVNTRYRHLHEDYEKKRPVALAMAANHPRFLTDVGFRNDAIGAIQSTGQPGYVQYGPAIPMKAGYYRVRWIGSLQDAGNGDIGFVEIWSDGTRLSREPVRFSPPVTAHVRIAQLDFSLPKPVRSLEYRFFVNAGIRLSLERIELFSGLAIPGETP